MKLATLRDGSRDGRLAVVCRDLTRAVVAETVVSGLETLQQLLDYWLSTQPKVAQIYATLNTSVGSDPRNATFPRCQWVPAGLTPLHPSQGMPMGSDPEGQTPRQELRR
jgi:fumarylacetoacetate (FAA) hydrolase